MGNKLGKKRQAVEEKYTRPQGLYQNPDVDNKKLRKLILKSRLAPCYPGDEEGFNGLEECPICFLYYPSLNRSRCCAKGICTECFLQMKPSRSTRSTQCPFCKRFQYSVDYRGMRTEEEKEMEQIEEQKVIEARVRMRQKERIEEEERVERRRAVGVSSEIVRSGGGEPRELPSTSTSAQHGGIVPSNASPSLPATRRLLQPRQNRTDDFDLDLEHLMFMEAIWRSIQESGPHLGGPAPLGQSSSTHVSPAGSREAHSPSGGLACAVASMAERQLTDGITNAVAPPPPPPPPPHLLAEEHSPVPGRGDSFDEQMMLAMALSLADARSTRSNSDAGDW